MKVLLGCLGVAGRRLGEPDGLVLVVDYVPEAPSARDLVLPLLHGLAVDGPCAEAALERMLALGPLAVGLVFGPLSDDGRALLGALAWLVIAGFALEGIGLLAHARDMKRQGGEGAAAHYVQTTQFGYTYRSRNSVLGVTLLGMFAFALFVPQGAVGLTAWFLLALAAAAAAVVGRMLFYALVIPTTMPGAFFWRNPAFQEHARETGLAKMPQVGVAMDCH